MSAIIPIRYVLVPKFTELTGWTEDAIQKKISRGQWIEGIHYRRRDGRLLINLEEYDKWVESPSAVASARPAIASS